MLQFVSADYRLVITALDGANAFWFYAWGLNCLVHCGMLGRKYLFLVLPYHMHHIRVQAYHNVGMSLPMPPFSDDNIYTLSLLIISSCHPMFECYFRIIWINLSHTIKQSKTWRNRQVSCFWARMVAVQYKLAWLWWVCRFILKDIAKIVFACRKRRTLESPKFWAKAVAHSIQICYDIF